MRLLRYEWNFRVSPDDLEAVASRLFNLYNFSPIDSGRSGFTNEVKVIELFRGLNIAKVNQLVAFDITGETLANQVANLICGNACPRLFGGQMFFP